MRGFKSSSLVLIAVSALALAGCASSPKSSDAAKAETTDNLAAAASPAAKSAAEAPAEFDLAAQAERDVQAMLALRQTQPQASQQAAVNAAPPQVQWITPRPAAPPQPTVAAAPPPPIEVPPAAVASPVEIESAIAADPIEAALGSATQPAVLAANEPAQPLELPELLAELNKQLYAQSKSSDARLRELMLIAATTMIDGEHSLNPQALAELTDVEREILAQMQLFFAGLGERLASSDDSQEAITAAVDELRKNLVHQPQLKLTHETLCMSVEGFGKLVPFDKASFMAGQEQRVIVYVEVENFQSEANSKGEWVTELSQELVIYNDSDGLPVWRTDWQTAPDVTTNKRRDFYLVNVVTLPKALTLGKYQLKISVRDNKSNAEAETSIPFTIVADAKLAAKLP